MSLSERLYRLLLRLYSPKLRREYGDAMEDAFRRMVADARASGGRWSTLLVWRRVLADLARNAPADALGIAPRASRPRPGKPPRRRRPAAVWTARITPRFQDFRYGLRTLRRQPLFVIVASLTVAIGVGATTTIFSAANGLLLRAPVGVREADRLVTVHRIDAQATGFHAFGTPYYRHLAASGAVEELAAFDVQEGGLTLEGTTSRVSVMVVSGNYFRVVGVRPHLGRLFDVEEDTAPGRAPVAVIGHRLWEQRFGADHGVIGRHLRLNGRDFTIVGVAEPGFQGHVAIFPGELWVPLSAEGLVRGLPDFTEEGSPVGLELIGRMAPGATIEQARQRLDAAATAVAAERGDGWFGVEVLEYSPIFAAVRQPLIAFFAALFTVAGVLLTITAVNVASLLLSRGAARSREIGVRLALGASRSRLVGQLLTESSMLFVLGGGLGVLFTVWGTGLLAGVDLPVPVTFDLDLRPDLRVLSFALLVSGATGLVFGLSPALHATRRDVVWALRAPDMGWSRHRMRNLLVFTQVAGSAVLLVVAGLLVRSLGRAGAAEIGLDPEGVVAFTVDTRAAGRSAADRERFYTRLLERTRGVPGIEAAALIDVPPLTLSNQQTIVSIPGRPPEPGVGLQRVELASVSPGYFETVRIDLLAGRDFGAADVEGGPSTIIVNETLARFVWPDESPIGGRLGFGSVDRPADVEVVGIVRDSKVRSAAEEPRMLVYAPWGRTGGRDMTLLARAVDGPTGQRATAEVRELIRELDPALPPAFVVPYPELIGISLLPGRLAAALAAAFGAVGTLLAAIGLYGLLAYSVVQRSREIGIRMALGAERRQVSGLVVRSGLWLTGTGLLVGLPAAAGVAQLLQTLLFDVSPLDPLTYLVIAIGLAAVAALACWLPARRAAATDPAIALRVE